MTSRDPRLAAWREADLASALSTADRDAIEQSESIRAVILELVAQGGSDDDLFDACAGLGRLVAMLGGTATLAALTLDHAAEAIGAAFRARDPARASLFEGFTRALLEKARSEANAQWEFPRCAVPLDAARAAIACGGGWNDEEISLWAARVARAMTLRGFRSAVVRGSGRPVGQLVAALRTCGIVVDVTADQSPAPDDRSPA